MRGGTAIVTCLERLVGKNYRSMGQSTLNRQCFHRQSPARITLRVSHIFRKSADDRWKMLHRHASKPPGSEGVTAISTVQVKTGRATHGLSWGREG